MNRTFKDYALLTLKGIGMGAADVVPGVSGGTIAFIVGIYEELIDSIKSINLTSLKMLCSLKFSRFWKAVNGNFLLAILSGIGLSVFSLAKLASIWFVSREVAQWNAKTVIAFAAGAVAAYAITITTPAETSNDLWFIFLCGAIAICAMILPGISGSFILVLLGKYFFIMDAVKSLRISVLLVFAGGSVIGISLFSRALSYALHRFHDITIAILSGFMLGSLK